MTIKPYVALLITLGIFISGITITSVQGIWTTQSQKSPERLEQVEYADQYDPADIRGSYTFAEISRLYNVPMEDLAAAFNQDVKIAETLKCKDIGTIFADAPYEIGTSSMRMFVAYYLGLPCTFEEDTYLTETAAAILNGIGAMTQDQEEYLSSHTIAGY